MKKFFALFITVLIVALPLTSVYAEETIDETEKLTEAITEEIITEEITTIEETTVEDTTADEKEEESTIDALTIEQIRANMISIISSASAEQILAIEENVGIALDRVVELTGWDYLREFCDIYMTQISWIIFAVAVAVALFRTVKTIKKNTDISTKASNNAVDIAEQAKDTALTVEKYAAVITETKELIETIIAKYEDAKTAEQDRLAEIEKIKATEAEKEKGQADALVALASILNDMLQLSSLPDAQKDAIYTKFETIKNSIEGK